MNNQKKPEQIVLTKLGEALGLVLVLPAAVIVYGGSCIGLLGGVGYGVEKINEKTEEVYSGKVLNIKKGKIVGELEEILGEECDKEDFNNGRVKCIDNICIEKDSSTFFDPISGSVKVCVKTGYKEVFGVDLNTYRESKVTDALLSSPKVEVYGDSWESKRIFDSSSRARRFVDLLETYKSLNENHHRKLMRGYIKKINGPKG